MSKLEKPRRDMFCPSGDWQHLATFTAPPDIETDFGINPYHRSLWQSADTGHIVNCHSMDLTAFYQCDYWSKTYPEGPKPVFDKIMALPTGRSDNKARVARINAFWKERALDAPKTLLDIGSGLAVFPAAMQAAGWQSTALDPDPRAVEHAEDTAGVEGLAGDFLMTHPGRRFGLVSLNKVLEHVREPTAMLWRVHKCLAPGGVVYVEVPDGEVAIEHGADREEFYIEHHCAFSMVSLAMLVHQAGFRAILIERLVEPSGKFTLRAFLETP